MSLEPRSGHKTLLKLLLAKTIEVLDQSEANSLDIQINRVTLEKMNVQLVLIKKQLELLTGEENYG